MQASNNPFQRVKLYRDAAAAVEKMSMLKKVSHIPDKGDYIELANGLVVSKEGKLYKSDGAFGIAKKLLGTANLSVVNEDSNKDDTV